MGNERFSKTSLLFITMGRFEPDTYAATVPSTLTAVGETVVQSISSPAERGPVI
jgi:hypothetical protein